MSTRRDFDKAKRRDLGKRGEPIERRNPAHGRDFGWRLEYPVTFPVTITRKENNEDRPA